MEIQPKTNSTHRRRGKISAIRLRLFLSAALGCLSASAETLPLVAKWSRFEQTLQSSVGYASPFQQAALKAIFISPLGETNSVPGFWDGDRTWRVRFSPDQPGRWTFTTECSDPANRGLNRRAGQFLCTAPGGTNRFRQHGPLRIAFDRRHFEHADGTPFFWLADTAWNGARMSDPDDWDFYVRVRAAQKFSAVQWAVPGGDAKGQAAFSGAGQMVINPDFFQRLDAKVNALNRAGLLSVIAPFRNSDELRKFSTEQNILFLRYLAARWGANDVAWLLDAGSDLAEAGDRLKQTGRAAFASGSRGPVVVQAPDFMLENFRNENWVDVIGYASAMDESSFQKMQAGPFAAHWQRQPARPLINICPPAENSKLAGRGPISADEIRRAIWRSLLAAPTAGVSYRAAGVENWDTKIEPRTGSDLPVWQKSLFLPAAKQMSRVADFFGAIDFWRLAPAENLVTESGGGSSARPGVAAAGTETNDLGLVFAPDSKSVEIPLFALPAPPVVRWFNIQNGEFRPAVGMVKALTCKFAAPAGGDWLLVIQTGTSGAGF